MSTKLRFREKIFAFEVPVFTASAIRTNHVVRCKEVPIETPSTFVDSYIESLAQLRNLIWSYLDVSIDLQHNYDSILNIGLRSLQEAKKMLSNWKKNPKMMFAKPGTNDYLSLLSYAKFSLEVCNSDFDFFDILDREGSAMIPKDTIRRTIWHTVSATELDVNECVNDYPGYKKLDSLIQSVLLETQKAKQLFLVGETVYDHFNPNTTNSYKA
jgi:hypothetical protein